MREYNASGYRGKQIVKLASRLEGRFLHDVYNHWSAEKQRAYEYCYEGYEATDDHANFSICSHNAYSFTCSWSGTVDGEKIIIYVTKDEAYLVWLER